MHCILRSHPPQNSRCCRLHMQGFFTPSTACSSVFAAAQMSMDESSRHTEVFNYLHSNTYPSDADKNTKRGIRQRAAMFELKEGVLCLKGTKRQWISCPKQQQQILRACHDDSLGCFTCMQTVAEKCLVSYDYS